ncbi:MAG: hypothetical protein ACLR56_02390 [Oscillospiraceae bacterium]
MHWGNEYQTSPNTWQKTIAQSFKPGVNDNRQPPHVIQPVELIRPEGGEGHNMPLFHRKRISNQRQELMDSCPSGHTGWSSVRFT